MNCISKICLVLLFFVTLNQSIGRAESGNRVPHETWQKYEKVEEAGFSPEKLEMAKAYFDTIGAAAVMVVYDGAIVAEWGDVKRRYRCHSARKSLMSAMYGIYIAKGLIDSTKTMAQLGIDDSPDSLTEQEKQAKIVDLLAARSGVYHTAAYEPATNPKPARGSYALGTNWCYNNWDFNTLLPIFEKETGLKFFDEFDKSIARPIQMQDFDPSHGYYHLEPDKSEHPAYPFRMSARDMARFGVLFARNGRWGDKQIIPEDYVKVSTSAVSTDTWFGGYGYLWWISDKKPFVDYGMYSALGLGEQSIDVLPNIDLVFVLRTDTYRHDQVESNQRQKLLELVLDARTGQPNPAPEMVQLEEEPPFVYPALTEQELAAYAGEYPLPVFGQSVKIRNDAGRLLIEFGEGEVPLIRKDSNEFYIQDFGDRIFFNKGAEGDTKLVSAFMILDESYGLLQQNKVDEGLALAVDGLKIFPDDVDLLSHIANVNFRRGAESLSKALQYSTLANAHRLSYSLEQSRVSWWMDEVQSTINPPVISEAYLKQLIGEYDIISITMDSGQLVYHRQGFDESHRLAPLTDRIFSVEDTPTLRIRFILDENGRAGSLIRMYSDGRRSEAIRNKI